MKTFRKRWPALMLGFVFTAIGAKYSLANAPVGQYMITADTVYDTKTTLTWQRNHPSGTYTHAEAKTYCQNLNLGSLGWRLPTMKELLTIVDDTQATPSIDTNAFSNAQEPAFWTSSARVNKPGEFWYVHFVDGETSSFDPTQPISLRCVQ